jgi:hypothetical protein
MRPWTISIAAGWLLAAAATAAEPQGAASPETRARMHEIFAAVAAVLPDSLDAQRFSDPARRQAILAELGRLAAGGKALETHGRSRDASFGFLSRTLARDAEEIRQRYAEDRFDEARFLFHELTQDCVACHSRLPSGHDADLGRRLMDEQRVAALPLDERARLELATRQFDRAQATLEAMLASSEYTANDLELEGALHEYLELCVRVRRDFESPARALERFAARPDLREGLRARVLRWVESLREIAARKPAASPLATAQSLLATGRDRRRFADEQDALVYDVAASAELHRFADTAPPGPEAAYAFFRLGEIESRIGRSFWVSQTEAYLETSIRMAPAEPFAPQALAELEEFLISGYTGSAGQNVPEDVRRQLAELHALVEGARAAPPRRAERQVGPAKAR